MVDLYNIIYVHQINLNPTREYKLLPRVMGIIKNIRDPMQYSYGICLIELQ
jgi:hypothetical protein